MMQSNPDLNEKNHWREILHNIGKIAAPSTVVVGLSYYFGYTRTKAIYQFFGIHQSMLEFSTQDYALHSLQVVFEPIVGGIILGLGGMWIHFFIHRLLTGNLANKYPRLPRTIISLFFFLGIIVSIPGAIASTLPTAPLFIQITWSIGFGLMGYSLYLYIEIKKHLQHEGEKTLGFFNFREDLIKLSLLLLLALAILGLFWTAANYAVYAGEKDARRIVEEMSSLPNVIVYSKYSLNLDRSSIKTKLLDEEQNSYLYRYEGLKLLIRSNDKYFLLPEDWSESNPITIILSDSDEIRIEVTPGENITP